MAREKVEDFDILRASAAIVAPRLLGCELERVINGKTARVMIVETEAYDQHDAASHSYRGRTPRTDVMFGPAGHLYVYFTYGMHYCMNIVTGAVGEGSAVLIRAAMPLEGSDIIEINRGGKTGVEATNGPAKLCQALAVTKAMNDHDLHEVPLRLIVKPPLSKGRIARSPRIGISKEKAALLRFYVKDSAYVSHI